MSSYFFAMATRGPTENADKVDDVAPVACVVGRPPAEIEEEKHLKQIEKAIDYYLKTHPNFAANFTIPRRVGYFGDDGVRIGFVEHRWANILFFHAYFGFGEIGAARRAVRIKVRQITDTIQRLHYRPLVTTESAQERNHFFWALMDLVLVADTENLQSCYGRATTYSANDDVRSATFLSLDLDESSWMRDVKKMLDRLKTMDFSQLERRLLELLNLPELLEHLKENEVANSLDGASNPLKQLNQLLSPDSVERGDFIDPNLVYRKYLRMQAEKPEKIVLSKKLESMFLRVPCRPLIDTFHKTLPFDFLIEYGDHELWSAEAAKVFMPELRQVTDLITPLITNVLSYLWDPISPEETKLSEAKIEAEYNLSMQRAYSYYRFKLDHTRITTVNLCVQLTPVPDLEFLQLIQSNESEIVKNTQKILERDKREKRKSNHQEQKNRQRQKWSQQPRHQHQHRPRKYDHSRANFSKCGGR